MAEDSGLTRLELAKPDCDARQTAVSVLITDPLVDGRV